MQAEPYCRCYIFRKLRWSYFQSSSPEAFGLERARNPPGQLLICIFNHKSKLLLAASNSKGGGSAPALPCSKSRTVQDRQHQCCENSNNDNDHQQFNPGESAFWIH